MEHLLGVNETLYEIRDAYKRYDQANDIFLEDKEYIEELYNELEEGRRLERLENKPMIRNGTKPRFDKKAAEEAAKR